MCRFGHDEVADVLVIFRVHGHAALVQKFRRRGHIQRDDGIAAACVGGAVVCAVFRVIGVERAGVGLHALLLHGGIAVGKVLRRVAGRSGRTRRVIAAGIAVRGAVVAADHRGRQLPRRGRDDKQRKARGQHARPCTAVARSLALFLMHPLEHALGKALRRVELGHFLEHRVHDHQFREILPAVLAVLYVREHLFLFVFAQFSVHKGRERGGVLFTTFHLALISSRLHSVTFDEVISKKFPFPDKKLRKSDRPLLMRDLTVPSSIEALSAISV